MRVVVVGSGIAGLISATRAARAGHDVVLVTKGALAESNTTYAQGGIAVALFPDDSVASHIADTLRAGVGLNDPRAVEVLCTEGPARVRELLALGVGFDRDADGELSRGHEAAHSARRVLHAGGDATGLAIETGLLAALRALPVEVHEHTTLREIVVDDAGERAIGIEVRRSDGEVAVLSADAVVLASGGAGQLFAHTTNPTVTTGDGIAAAYRAGAEVADLEFVQFHPTALAIPGTPLVSEAVRGDGAVLRDEAGRRFMLDVHPDGELAPRDVVARGIAAAMARQGGRPVLLDATGLGREKLTKRFPGITRVTTDAGFDWTREPIPITPAAHYLMGGIRTDDTGRTTIRGLYAVGEAACTGVHGANRLASNSLLESLVFASRAADALAGEWVDVIPRAQALALSETTATATAIESATATATATATVTPTSSPTAPATARSTATSTSASTPTETARSSTGHDDTPAPFTRTALRDLLWTHAGLTRDGGALAAALATLDTWTRDLMSSTIPRTSDILRDADIPPAAHLVGGTGSTGIADIEDANLLVLGRLVVRAALAREESRGAHFRTDHPDTRPELAHSTAWVAPADERATTITPELVA